MSNKPTNLDLKDSGTRQTFSTGAVRDAQENKGRFDLIPFWPLLAYATIMEAGAKKYIANNWRKGMPISKYINSAERHLEKYKAGFRDEPHLWQSLWNIGCAIHTQVELSFNRYPSEFNDLYSDLNSDHTVPVELFSEFEKTVLSPYKTTEIETTSPQDAAYLAALIDGEGGFSICSLKPRPIEKRKKHYEARISVYNTKYELIEWIKKRFGGYVATRKRNEKHAVGYSITWTHTDVDRIINLVQPYVVIKRNQMDLVIKFRSIVSNIKGGRGGTPKNIVEQLEDMKRQMNHINSKGVVMPKPNE